MLINYLSVKMVGSVKDTTTITVREMMNREFIVIPSIIQAQLHVRPREKKVMFTLIKLKKKELSLSI